MDNNFLFIGAGEQGIPVSMIKKMIKVCNIKNIYAVVLEKEDSPLFNEAIYIWDAFHGRYPAMDRVAPIDRNYKNPISQFSVEILHQISRNGNWNFEKRVDIYYTNLKYWDDFLETRQIDHVIFAGVPHEVYDYIIYLLCKAKKIKVYMNAVDGYKLCMTSKGYYMLDSIEEHTIELEHVFKNLKNKYENLGEEDLILPEYIEKDIENIRHRFNNAENNNSSLMNNGRIREIKRYYANPMQNLKNTGMKKKVLKDLCKYIIGIFWTKRLINRYESIAMRPNISDKYIFYALHYQPEATSSPLGGMYANQLLAIRLIAHNLPEGYWVYVKEHPHQISFGREPSYYNELSKIPKVKIISQKICSEWLIKNSIAVATLTGTVILESQIIQKPCLCFGYTSKMILDGVYKIDTNEDCAKALNEIIDGSVRVTTLKDLRLYLLAMEEICYSKTDESEYYDKLIQYVNLS